MLLFFFYLFKLCSQGVEEVFLFGSCSHYLFNYWSVSCDKYWVLISAEFEFGFNRTTGHH